VKKVCLVTLIKRCTCILHEQIIPPHPIVLDRLLSTIDYTKLNYSAHSALSVDGTALGVNISMISACTMLFADPSFCSASRSNSASS